MFFCKLSDIATEILSYFREKTLMLAYVMNIE